MWTIKDFEEKQKQGKIRGFSTKSKPKRKPRKESKYVAWLRKELSNLGQKTGLKIEEEYRFHPVRKWRFDFAIPGEKIGIEYEGVMSQKSRHTTITGFSGDVEKYNEAQKMGWIVLRYTVLNRELHLA